MEILYADADILACIKPPRVLSTDEPGGLPELVRQALGNPRADVRTVHRLDRVVSGVMVLARNSQSASELSRQIREGETEKIYRAVVHGLLPEKYGRFTDLLARDKARRMTYVTEEPGKDAREASLRYRVLEERNALSLVEIQLETGRTHQIRVQFSSRGFPLVGERKYAVLEDSGEIALWSYSFSFYHPRTGEKMTISQNPPEDYPWSLF